MIQHNDVHDECSRIRNFESVRKYFGVERSDGILLDQELREVFNDTR